MATGTLILPIGGAIPADGSTDNAFPAVSLHTSTDADDPSFRRFVAAFDDTAKETISFGFRLPVNWASGGALKFHWYPAGTNSSKNVVWQAAVQAVTPGDSTVMTSLDAVNAGGGWASVTTACPGTIGYPTVSSITLTLSSVAAGDSMALIFQRDPTNGSDDTVGDVIIMDEFHLEYTTT